MAWPYETFWDCCDKLYDYQAADLVPGLSTYQNTVHLNVPERNVISYHYKDTRTEKPFDYSYTEILLSHDDGGHEHKLLL